MNYEILVGNIGCVYVGESKTEASEYYREYVSQSKNGYGRASGEPVSLWEDGEIIREWEGSHFEEFTS